MDKKLEIKINTLRDLMIEQSEHLSNLATLSLEFSKTLEGLKNGIPDKAQVQERPN